MASKYNEMINRQVAQGDRLYATEMARRAECAKQYPVGTKLSNGQMVVEVVEAPTHSQRVLLIAGDRVPMDIETLADLCKVNNIVTL